MHKKHNDSSEKTKSCPVCSTDFVPKRVDQKYCSSKCRKNNYQKHNRSKNPVNSTYSPTKRRDNLELFDRSRCFGEMYYNTPPWERDDFLNTLVVQAKNGNSKVRNVLNNQMMLRADSSDKKLFYKHSPSIHQTITQLANDYCRRTFGKNVREVIFGSELMLQ